MNILLRLGYWPEFLFSILGWYSNLLLRALMRLNISHFILKISFRVGTPREPSKSDSAIRAIQLLETTWIKRIRNGHGHVEAMVGFELVVSLEMVF